MLREKLTATDFDPNSPRPVSSYPPHQRGWVAYERKVRSQPTGNRRLRDGDDVYEECPDCGFLLRVRRKPRGRIMLWCPCGFEAVLAEFMLDAAPAIRAARKE